MNVSKWLLIVLLWLPVSSVAQNRVGTLKAPSAPTPIEVRERTIRDLLYFPFSCISDPMTTRELAWQVVENTFGTCEAINGSPGLHAVEPMISLIVVLPSAFVTIVGMVTGLGMTFFSVRKMRLTNSITTWSKTFKM